jgi:hypothetical protein
MNTRNFFLVTLLSLMTFSFAAAQGYSVSNLTPELKTIIDNVKNQCSLNQDQTTRFTNDYVWFLNENEKNKAANANNQVKLNIENQKTLFQVGSKFRAYLSNDQFAKLKQMINEGKLNPSGSAPIPVPSQVIEPKPAPSGAGASSGAAVQTGSATKTAQSNVTALLDQLAAHINVTPAQVAQAKPILQEYDKKVIEINTRNAGNDSKIQAEMGPVNTQAIEKLKPILNNDQLTRLVAANVMQQNILSGKNLSAEQKLFLDKLRSQYQLNDVQLMSVILVMVQAKVRGDAINSLSKTNQQAAAQELGKLLKDLDGQLKASLNPTQYTNIKSDIEKLVKGQKL